MKSKFLAVKYSEEEMEELKYVAEVHRRSKSDIVRFLIHDEYVALTKKD